MLTQNVAHECPAFAKNDENYSAIYAHIPHWKMEHMIHALRHHNAIVSSVLKAGDADWHRVRNDYERTLIAATAKDRVTYFLGEPYHKAAARGAIRFYHRWLYERGAYVAFIEYAKSVLEKEQG